MGPVQPLAMGVRRYVTVSFTVPVFTKTWLSDVVGTPLFDHPVTLPEEGVQVHVNDVPETFDVRFTAVEVLLQMVLEAGELERSGTGKTVTT
jgi:hypothetical protein